MQQIPPIIRDVNKMWHDFGFFRKWLNLLNCATWVSLFMQIFFGFCIFVLFLNTDKQIPTKAIFYSFSFHTRSIHWSGQTNGFCMLYLRAWSLVSKLIVLLWIAASLLIKCWILFPALMHLISNCDGQHENLNATKLICWIWKWVVSSRR